MPGEHEQVNVFSEQEKNTARRLIAEAKRKAGLNVEVIEKRKPHDPIKRSMAQLLSDAKRCWAYHEDAERDCGCTWQTWKRAFKFKCYWCEKFEQQRNAENVNEGARHILEGKK